MVLFRVLIYIVKNKCLGNSDGKSDHFKFTLSDNKTELFTSNFKLHE